jgi:hypothetical protein
MSIEQPTRSGDIRFTESGEIEVFDGQNWSPVRKLPQGGPVVFRGDKETGQRPLEA